MKVVRSLLIAIPALMLVNLAAAHADNAPTRQQPQQQPQQQQQMPPQQGYYQSQQGFSTQQGYFQGQGCMPNCPPPCMPNCPPPEPPCCQPPPWVYYCANVYNCAPPILRGGPPVSIRPMPQGQMLPPAYVAPGGSGGYYGRMSGNGCEVQQGNNGEFVVLSASGGLLFRDRSEYAEENAERVEAAYENGDTGLCGNLKPRADRVHSI